MNPEKDLGLIHRPLTFSFCEHSYAVFQKNYLKSDLDYHAFENIAAVATCSVNDCGDTFKIDNSLDDKQQQHKI